MQHSKHKQLVRRGAPGAGVYGTRSLPLTVLLFLCIAGSGCTQVQRLSGTNSCAPVYVPGRIQTIPLHGLPKGSQIRGTDDSLTGGNIVVIVSGNGFPAGEYKALADHLAHNGFIAAIVQRPFGSDGNYRFVINAVNTVLGTLNRTADNPQTRIALIGHSAGGATVVNAAAASAVEKSRLPIHAVVGLAPNALNSAHLDGRAVPNYLLIYGSQDEDLTGFSAKLREAFRAYDDAGNEYSSTCNSPPGCFYSAPPSLEKTMIYIHGADHAGLIGSNRAAGGRLPRNTEYLTPADQLCIVKTYVTGFLRWKLMNDVTFRDVIRGVRKPPEIARITTNEPDALNNPAGSPITMEFQISPSQRRVIRNFETRLGDYRPSNNVVVRRIAPGDFSKADHYLRHHTGLALISWRGAGSVRWKIPEHSRVGRTYTHVAFRVGQLHAAPAPYDNPTDIPQSFRLGLEDAGGQISWQPVTGIAPPDPSVRAPSKAISNMQTVRIPIANIRGIDLNNVRYLHLRFEEGSHGTLLLDNVEWHRDSPFLIDPRSYAPLALPAELALPPQDAHRISEQ